MSSLFFLFRFFRNSVRDLWKSKYRWIFVAFVLWIYRVEFVSATSPIIQIIQMVTFVYIAKKAMDYRPGIIWYTLNRTNSAVKYTFLFYVFALLSSLWSFWPVYSLALTFQDVLLLLMSISFFSLAKSYRSVEIMFLLFGIAIVLFEAVVIRLTWQPSLIIHHLTSGSVAAIMLTYCFAERLDMRKQDKLRSSLYLGIMIVSAIVLITSTSSGANASAVFGIGIALFFSTKRWLAIIFMLFAGFLFFNREYIDDLILLIMPGKTMETVQSGTGRDLLWSIIYRYIDQKPFFGWGFGCVERAITDSGEFVAIDAHNSYLGLIGGLGYVGITFFGLAMFVVMKTVYKNIKRPGYLGLLCALSCTLLNGYSFGFLSGKTCGITIMFMVLVALTCIFRQKQRIDEIILKFKNQNR